LKKLAIFLKHKFVFAGVLLYTGHDRQTGENDRQAEGFHSLSWAGQAYSWHDHHELIW
jgi:hypothetical protein